MSATRADHPLGGGGGGGGGEAVSCPEAAHAAECCTVATGTWCSVAHRPAAAVCTADRGDHTAHRDLVGSMLGQVLIDVASQGLVVVDGIPNGIGIGTSRDLDRVVHGRATQPPALLLIGTASMHMARIHLGYIGNAMDHSSHGVLVLAEISHVNTPKFEVACNLVS